MLDCDSARQIPWRTLCRPRASTMKFSFLARAIPLRALPPIVDRTSKRAARDAMTPIVLATLGFGAWHSLLSARSIKNVAIRVLGERRGRGWYRLAFNAQSLVTTGALVWFVISRPQRPLYHVPMPFRALNWAAQAACLLTAVWSVKELGPKRFLGIQGVQDVSSGQNPVVEPETQTPHFDEESFVDEAPERGPYRWSRHPLEWAPLGLLWLTPTLKTNWLAFNVAATIYMIVGAYHEERLLLNRGGDGFRGIKNVWDCVWSLAREIVKPCSRKEQNVFIRTSIAWSAPSGVG
jgi:hypothetical protein